MNTTTDLGRVLTEIAENMARRSDRGEIATYIPELGRIDPKSFGIAVVDANGNIAAAGDSDTPFSIQSVSKVFTLTLALGKAHFLTGDPTITIGNAFAASEQRTGFRNRALANYMRTFGILENPVDYTLGVYFHHCAIAMSCRQLALAGRYLVHHGRNPATKGSVVSAALTLLSAPTRCGDRLEFDTSRFESWHPSQSPWSLPGNFGCWRKYGPFRGLEGKDPVSRQEFWRNRTESRESRGESLHDGFSISENWIRGRPETGCVSAETGSNPHGIGGRVVESLVKVRGRPISDAVDEAADHLGTSLKLPHSGLCSLWEETHAGIVLGACRVSRAERQSPATETLVDGPPNRIVRPLGVLQDVVGHLRFVPIRHRVVFFQMRDNLSYPRG